MTARRDKPALDLMEEAGYLLRNAPANAVAAYYIGTLPFLLAFLFYWTAMGRSSDAYEYCSPAALGVAILFLWMSAWQAVFAQALRSQLTGTPPARFRRLAFVQAAVQPTKFIALPIALLITVPLGAVFAFYQSLPAVSLDGEGGLRQVCAAAWQQAKLRHMQNWTVLGLVTMLAIVVFCNVGVALLVAPQLLKSFLGIETPLTQGEISPFNSTFLAIAMALSYAIVDPLIKSIYVLRCFYGESLVTGEDLRAQLKAIAAQTSAAALVIITVVAFAAVPKAQAQPAPPPAAAARGPDATELNRSIDEVLKRSEFSWRLPKRAREADGKEKNWLTRTLSSWFDKLGQWFDDFFEWLNRRARTNRTPVGASHGPPALRAWYYVLIGVVVLLCVLLLFASRRRTRRSTTAEIVTIASPDLANEETSADQLPSDAWLRTARECAGRNDFRLAVRALYLATLAHLGASSLIAIGRGKTNLEYARELRRRVKSKPEILPAFTDTVGIFERAWYGMHDVDAAAMAQVEANLSTMRSRVEQ